MMVGIAEPRQRGEQHPFPDRRLRPPDHLGEQEAVGEHGQVVPMLLEGRDRDHHGRVLGKGRDGGPGKFGEFHGVGRRLWPVIGFRYPGVGIRRSDRLRTAEAGRAPTLRPRASPSIPLSEGVGQECIAAGWSPSGDHGRKEVIPHDGSRPRNPRGCVGGCRAKGPHRVSASPGLDPGRPARPRLLSHPALDRSVRLRP